MSKNPRSGKRRVLVVEDDEFIQGLLAALLDGAGHQSTRVGSARELLAELRTTVYDLVLLDLGLPDEDGLSALRKIRAQSQVPVIVLTQRQDLENRLEALRVGADDFLTKPIEPQELLLRVGRMMERGAGESAGGVPDTIEFGPWALSTAERRFTHRDRGEIRLTRSEFDLLHVLFRSPNRVQAREVLLEAVNRFEAASYDRTVDVLVSRLRKKLALSSHGDSMIQTIQGIGYRLSTEHVVED